MKGYAMIYRLSFLFSSSGISRKYTFIPEKIFGNDGIFRFPTFSLNVLDIGE